MKFAKDKPFYTVICIILLQLSLAKSVAADDAPFSRIVFFGDSLSDPGNIYILESNQVSQAPYEVIPTYPYAFRGGFRFTNGKTWTQSFAGELELGSSGKPALSKRGKFTNYAFGSARARSFGDRPSALEQYANYYLADFPGGAGPEALYVLQFGGNDIRDALDPAADPTSIITEAVTAEANLIAQLYIQGAREFLVGNVPDLSLSPAIRLADLQGSSQGLFPPGFLIGSTQQLVAAYNANLEGALAGLEQMFPDLVIKRLDLFGALNEVYQNPGQFGIIETDAACLTFGVLDDAICAKPQRHIFWDGIHPTRRVHRILAQRAVDLYED